MVIAAGQHFFHSLLLSLEILKGIFQYWRHLKQKEVYETQVASNWLFNIHTALIYRMSHCRYNRGMKS